MIDNASGCTRHALRVIREIVVVAAITAASICDASAQSRPFLFSVTTASGKAGRGVISGDLGYGERLFQSIGPEQSEQAATVQMAIGSRGTFWARTGLALGDPAATASVSAHAEILADLLSGSSTTRLFIGGGVLRDYAGVPVITARLGAARLGERWQTVGNVRLEHAFEAEEADGARRDALDVVTSAGLSCRAGASTRLGLEAVGEDLEGLIESDEAEGGAKFMVGPMLRYAPGASGLELLAGGGPVVHLSRSTAPAPAPGLPRDLSTRSGYVLRVTLGYRW